MAGMMGNYDLLVNAIIRPPRSEYNIGQLGPLRLRFGDLYFDRKDLELTNSIGLLVRCSWFEPLETQRKAKRLPCVVYLHGNSGCRMNAIECLPELLKGGFTVFTLDFAGCGISEGEYISLGYFEQDTVADVVKYIHSTGTVSQVALWGRSMGAATSLLYGARDHGVACLVLDSPFASLSRIAEELASSHASIPKMMVSVGLSFVKKTVNARAGFDIGKLEPIKAAKHCTMPAMFIHGQKDDFVNVKHTLDIIEDYACETHKTFFDQDGNHNSERPKRCKEKAIAFIRKHVNVAEQRVQGLLPEERKAAEVSPAVEDNEEEDRSSSWSSFFSRKKKKEKSTTDGSGAYEAFEDEYKTDGKSAAPPPQKHEVRVVQPGAYDMSGYRHDPVVVVPLRCSLLDLMQGRKRTMKITRKCFDENYKMGEEVKMLDIEVMAGWKAGTKITFPKEGDSVPGVISADIQFMIQEREDDVFKRDNNDLCRSVTVKKGQLGSTLPVKTLDGRELDVCIPSTATNGTTIKVVGEGFPIRKTGGRGDLILTVAVA